MRTQSHPAAPAVSEAIWNELFRIAVRIGHSFHSRFPQLSEDECLDISVECVSKAVEKFRSFNKEKGELEHWMSVICCNTFRSYLRKMVRIRGIFVDNVTKDGSELVERYYNPDLFGGGTPYKCSEPTANDSFELKELLLKFQESCREGDERLMAGMLIDGYDQEEIVAMLGRSENATNIFKSRVKAKMEKFLENSGYPICGLRRGHKPKRVKFISDRDIEYYTELIGA